MKKAHCPIEQISSSELKECFPGISTHFLVKRFHAQLNVRGRLSRNTLPFCLCIAFVFFSVNSRILKLFFFFWWAKASALAKTHLFICFLHILAVAHIYVTHNLWLQTDCIGRNWELWLELFEEIRICSLHCWKIFRALPPFVSFKTFWQI